MAEHETFSKKYGTSAFSRYPSKSSSDHSFDSNWMLNPCLTNQIMQHWLSWQQNILMSSWEIMLWQQIAIQKMYIDNMRWVIHSLQISDQPHTFFRYSRMNWLKPYETFSAHSVSSTRLISHMWIQSLSALQDGWRIITRGHPS
jgi:hypothetical protein